MLNDILSRTIIFILNISIRKASNIMESCKTVEISDRQEYCGAGGPPVLHNIISRRLQNPKYRCVYTRTYMLTADKNLHKATVFSPFLFRPISFCSFDPQRDPISHILQCCQTRTLLIEYPRGYIVHE